MINGTNNNEKELILKENISCSSLTYNVKENIFIFQSKTDLAFAESTYIPLITTSQIESTLNDISQIEEKTTNNYAEITFLEYLFDKTINSTLINPLLNETEFVSNEGNYKVQLENSTYVKYSNPETYINICKFENFILNIDFFDDSNNTSEEINQKIYEQIINNVIKNIEVLNEDGHVIKGKDNYFYHIATSENEINSANKKNNDTNKLSRIDLGECENKLRDHYKLNKNISLLILKYEKVANISSERQLQYEVYESLNKAKLNLSVCSNVQVNIYVPIVLSEEKQNLYNELQDLGYDLFDINNVFYQDICTPYKTSNGTDVILTDRINYYYYNDETQCQPNCQFSGYSFDTQNIKCECNIINTEINVENNQKEKKECAKSIYSSFYDILKFSNYKVLKCYKLAFNFKIFIKDKGNILTLIYFGIYLLSFIIYLIKGKEILKNDL